MVLIILAIGVVLIPVFLSHASANLLATRVTEEGMKEQYAADAGVEYALGHLLHGEEPVDGWPGWSAEFEMNSKAVTVTIINETDLATEDGQVYRITSTATGDDGSSTIIESWVWRNYVSGDITFMAGDFELGDGDDIKSSVYAAGDIDLGDGAQIKGDAYADGDIDLGDSAQIKDDACAAGDIELGAGAKILGDVSAGGAITLGEKAETDGNVCAGGDIWLGEKAKILSGDVYVTGDNANITLGVSAEIHGDVYVTGDNVNITLGVSAQIFGDVYVTGDSVNITLGDSAEIKGGVYATGAIYGVCDQVEDGCYPDYSEGYPDPPECPELPGIKIIVY